MIIDMEKYRHGHCRGGRGAAQGMAAAASVPEIYPYPETRRPHHRPFSVTGSAGNLAGRRQVRPPQ